jgi:23S rRNA pseudouridine1911/1915/1917 synthase
LKQSSNIISGVPDHLEMDEPQDLTADIELRQVPVSMAQHGDRLDRALAALVPEFSRSYLQQLIELGLVQLNDRTATKPSARVKAADRLAIELRPTPQSQSFLPQLMELDLMYQDEHLYVIHKPAGMVVHPAPGNWTGTLLNGLLAYDPQSALVPRAGIVHRLDKDTSGLMVVARNRQTMDALVQKIAAREVSRQYLALAHKTWSGADKVTVEAAIGRDPRNRLRMAVVDLNKDSGKTAKTDVYCLESGSQGCFVRCHLYTGRTHQIRVHMAHLGHPLVADAVYGGHAVGDMQRQALHAFRLAFIHPITGENLDFQVQPPEDFMRLLKAWGFSYNLE